MHQIIMSPDKNQNLVMNEYTLKTNLNTPRQANKVFEESLITYSICTLVTKHNEYLEMVESFQSKGFNGADCEYLFLDNCISNQYDAFTGYNLFLQTARGRYIILCHQDVILIKDDRIKLDKLIAELDNHDSNWGLLGNAGGEFLGQLAIRITDRFYGENRLLGNLPARVYSLDENFIIVKKSANLALSRDIAGYHLYGTDLCILGDILGYNAYVIDFHLFHKGHGKIDADFYKVLELLLQKYRHAFRWRYIQTTCTTLFLSNSRVALYFLNKWRALSLASNIAKQFPQLFR